MSSHPDPSMPRRDFAKNGIRLSVIGFGGIIARDMEAERLNAVVGEAVERGVNYFDVAPSYGDALERLGPALAPYRKNVFLACKTGERTADGAMKELHRCLTSMQTDYLDLFQLHAISDIVKDVDAVFAAGGAMDTFLAARKEGRIRHIGFSAHTEEAAVAAMARYDFDSALFPVNFSCWERNGFGKRIMQAAMEKGVARLAIKTLALARWPEDDPERKAYPKCWYKPVTDRRAVELALKFTLSQPVTAAVSSGDEKLLRLMLETVQNLAPITDNEKSELVRIAGMLPPIFPM